MLEYMYTHNIFAVNAQDKYMYVGSNTPVSEILGDTSVTSIQVASPCEAFR